MNLAPNDERVTDFHLDIPGSKELQSRSRAPNLLPRSNNRVRIITKQLYEYEGTLSQINQDKLQIILQDVIVKGKIKSEVQADSTQDDFSRFAEIKNQRLHKDEYIFFNKSDILKIYAIDTQTGNFLPSLYNNSKVRY